MQNGSLVDLGAHWAAKGESSENGSQNPRGIKVILDVAGSRGPNKQHSSSLPEF